MPIPNALLRLLILAACLAAWSVSAAPDKTPSAPADAHASAVAKAWEHFKKRFITEDGRVIDHYQNDISHSEGQGYAMLLAERHADRELFDRLWSWTRNNLQTRRDGLLAWSWGKRVNGEWSVLDYNNASDGDLLVALALARAGQRWNSPDYTTEAQRLAKSLREHLGMTVDGHSYLLTGYHGFADQEGLVLNPAYQIAAAYRALAGLDDKGFWSKIETDGSALQQAACGNAMGLPSDWVSIRSGKIAPSDTRPARFGYEAIRVFLYADWLEPFTTPCGAGKLLEVYQKDKRLFNWYALDGKEKSADEASAGYYAIASRLAEHLGKKNEAKQLRETADAHIANEGDGYYSHSLYLLTFAPR